LAHASAVAVAGSLDDPALGRRGGRGEGEQAADGGEQRDAGPPKHRPRNNGRPGGKLRRGRLATGDFKESAMAPETIQATDHKLYVAGEWTETGEWSEVHAPYDDTLIGR